MPSSGVSQEPKAKKGDNRLIEFDNYRGCETERRLDNASNNQYGHRFHNGGEQNLEGFINQNGHVAGLNIYVNCKFNCRNGSEARMRKAKDKKREATDTEPKEPKPIHHKLEPFYFTVHEKVVERKPVLVNLTKHEQEFIQPIETKYEEEFFQPIVTKYEKKEPIHHKLEPFYFTVHEKVVERKPVLVNLTKHEQEFIQPIETKYEEEFFQPIVTKYEKMEPITVTYHVLQRK
ncbi:hypothetical protein O6P43_027998 [Quillaja saponaria]|uniref:Uncharacterized protein n=1 Tax=Quillaja saponaria TaxID=32244 RepID=A0AAD7L5N4_QUISA|nr:hypothetical protein O6P43_027998 [Quillaja saponaria]